MSTMSADTFKLTVEAMRAHYKSGATSSYILNNVIAFDAQTQNELPPEVNQKINQIKDKTQNFSGAQRTAVEKPTQQYVNNQDFNTFKVEIEKARAKAKEDANNRIDKIFDTALDLGDKFPDFKDKILIAFRNIGDFFSGLLNQIVSFVTTLIDKIKQWLQTAFAEIKKFFENAFQAIKQFFENIS